jgi:hypothetical protein
MMKKTYLNYEDNIAEKKITLRNIKQKKQQLKLDEKHNKMDEKD